jgi:hypothetical protein
MLTSGKTERAYVPECAFGVSDERASRDRWERSAAGSRLAPGRQSRRSEHG